MSPKKYLGALTVEDRAKLEQRLVSRQSGRCFICDDPLDLVLQKGQLDVDHIDPLAEDGLDAENNFAMTHQSCNRSQRLSRHTFATEKVPVSARVGCSTRPWQAVEGAAQVLP